MNPRGTALTLRVIGGVAVLATLAAVFSFLQTVAATPPALVIGAAIFVVAGALAVALFGIAAILDHDVSARAETLRAIATLHDQPINAVTPDLSRPLLPVDLSAIEAELKRLGELVLLTDSERLKLRIAQLISSADEFVLRRAWVEADQVIHAAETLSNDDPFIRSARRRLEQSHRVAEEQVVTDAQREIESDMSRGAWEESESRAAKLAADYPENAVARPLLQRVRRERQIFTESATQRLYEEIRKDSERRQWRRALDHAQQLLEKFPTHEKADRVRAQLHTLQENAEIEERHEIEARIADLVKSRRFADAIATGEDLIRRFPTSPQVAKFQQLLPRLRELVQSPS